MNSTIEKKSAVTERAALKKRFNVRLGRVKAGVGVSKEDERALRRAHLTEGVDFVELGSGIFYSVEGVERLRVVIGGGGGGSAELRVQSAELGGGVGKGDVSREEREGGEGVGRAVALLPERGVDWSEGGRGGEPFLVRTMRCHFPNGQVVEVKIEGVGGGGAQRAQSADTESAERGFMRVRSSENFLPGMACWARVVRGESAWVFCGRADEGREATDAPTCPRSRGRW